MGYLKAQVHSSQSSRVGLNLLDQKHKEELVLTRLINHALFMFFLKYIIYV